jgi:hypothetical protein
LAHLINKEIAYMNKPKMQQIENKFYSLSMIKPKCLAPDLILVKTHGVRVPKTLAFLTF